MKLTQFQAEAVWLVLVHICGAVPEEMIDFVRYAKGAVPLSFSDNPLKYRFQGNLGFGGKLYFKSPLRVACYPEDETPERKRMVDHANEFLTVLTKSWTE